MRMFALSLAVAVMWPSAPARAGDVSFEELYAAPFIRARRVEKVRLGRSLGGSGGGYGRRMMCSGRDEGWEEHGRPHGGWGVSVPVACASCFAAGHGGCDYSCSIETYKCKAEWVPENSSDRSETYEGREDADQYDAEDKALNACRDAHWSSREEGRCRLTGCDTVKKEIESGRCQR